MSNGIVPKISVIVPVYKAEAYLHRCIDSLLAQTFFDFEILLVDDGSPDRSGEICAEYARKDRRVRVFRKNNGGVSSARQCGIDNVVGEYSIHVDPDDWVEPTMLEELYEKAKKEAADIVICDYFLEKEHRTVYSKQSPSALDNMTVLRELFQRLHGSCCNKLVKHICYHKYGVKFPLELSYGEDLFVNTCLVANCKRISYLPKAFYHYDKVINMNSLMKKRGEFILNQIKIFRLEIKKTLPDEMSQQIYPFILYYQALLMLNRGNRKSLSKFSTDFQELKPIIGRVNVPRKWKIIVGLSFKISPYWVHIMCRVRNCCKKLIAR